MGFCDLRKVSWKPPYILVRITAFGEKEVRFGDLLTMEMLISDPCMLIAFTGHDALSPKLMESLMKTTYPCEEIHESRGFLVHAGIEHI